MKQVMVFSKHDIEYLQSRVTQLQSRAQVISAQARAYKPRDSAEARARRDVEETVRQLLNTADKMTNTIAHLSANPLRGVVATVEVAVETTEAVDRSARVAATVAAVNAADRSDSSSRNYSDSDGSLPPSRDGSPSASVSRL